jgi:hypothetical protein
MFLIVLGWTPRPEQSYVLRRISVPASGPSTFRAYPTVSHSQPVQRTGGSRFAQSEMRTSSAAGSRR